MGFNTLNWWMNEKNTKKYKKELNNFISLFDLIDMCRHSSQFISGSCKIFLLENENIFCQYIIQMTFSPPPIKSTYPVHDFYFPYSYWISGLLNSDHNSLLISTESILGLSSQPIQIFLISSHKSI